jgi:hypothetical protein
MVAVKTEKDREKTDIPCQEAVEFFQEDENNDVVVQGTDYYRIRHACKKWWK